MEQKTGTKGARIGMWSPSMSYKTLLSPFTLRLYDIVVFYRSMCFVQLNCVGFLVFALQDPLPSYITIDSLNMQSLVGDQQHLVLSPFSLKFLLDLILQERTSS